MNNYCVDLNFNFEPFDNNFDIAKFKKTAHDRINPMDMNPQFLELLDLLGLKIAMAEYFYKTPKSLSGVHRDVLPASSATRINWIYGGADSVMNWYRPLNDIKKMFITPIGESYTYYEKEDVEIIFSRKVGFPSLVEVALPHDILMGDEERVCISAILKHKHKHVCPTFAESLLLFRDYLKL
jgi:hypothetical protein